VDFNDDGLLDLIVGERNGFINYFRRKPDGTLTAEPDIEAGGSTIDVGNNSAPFVVDWNEDGLLDLVIGNETGNLLLYINNGTPSAHSYGLYILIKVNGTPVDYSRTVPHVIDLNLDGKKDVVFGEDNGAVYYLENTGTNAVPAFSTISKLKSDGAVIQWPSGQTDTTVFFTDWNEDGRPDLLLGNYVKNVYLYPGLAPIEASDNQIPAASGLTINFALDAGVANGGRNYLLTGTTSGTDPGTLLPGGLATIPLNRDWFTDFILARLNTTVFAGFWGTFDATGRAAAALNAPPLQPGWIGKTLHFAYATASPWDYVSNAVPIEIVP